MPPFESGPGGVSSVAAKSYLIDAISKETLIKSIVSIECSTLDAQKIA